MTIVVSPLPLAQLADALPSWAWNALLAGGMLAPIAGLLISSAARSSSRSKRKAAGLFYLVSLPLLGLILVAQTESPLLVCPFLLLLPVGGILGILMLAPRGRAAEPRGFEVQPKREDKAG